MMTHKEWVAQARTKFGDKAEDWRFVCPVCKHEASVQDYIDCGAPERAIAFSCIGRYQDKCRDAFTEKGDGPCNYTGGGLIGLNPVVVDFGNGNEGHYFAFAEVQS